MKKSIIFIVFAIAVTFSGFAQYFPSGGYQGGTYGNVFPTHIIDIYQGWNGISTYLNPSDGDVEQLTDAIIDELIIMYNMQGMYWPAQQINSLDNWDTYSGYIVKVSEDVTLEIKGLSVSNKQVLLSTGWEIIPVISKDAVLSSTLFSGLSGLEVAKGIGSNQIYWPRYNINQMIYLQPGCGYYVLMNEPGSLDYAAADNVEVPVKPIALEFPESPWNMVVATAESHLVAFNLAEMIFESGDIIAAFNNSGWCAGIIQVSDPRQPFALSLFGDDPLSTGIDGFAVDESFSFRCHRPSSGETFNLQLAYNPGMNTGYFENHGMSEVYDVKMSVAGITNLASGDLRIYPNPTDGIINIDGLEGIAKVQIHNAFGIEICSKKIHLPEKLDLSDQSGGVYIIRIESNGKTYFTKLVME